jgi:hypothetical protein
MSLTASSITFPACNPGEAVAQTLGLRNYGDTAMHFSLSVVGLSAGARVLVEPQQGVVPPQTMQLVGHTTQHPRHTFEQLLVGCFLDMTILQYCKCASAALVHTMSCT